MTHRASRYWHTLRHLRLIQIGARLWAKVPRSLPAESRAPPARKRSGPWVPPARRKPSMAAPLTFRFLNETRQANGVPWGADAPSALWRYNLHYFDDLTAEGAALRRDWHLQALAKWIEENRPGHGVGWDPYPSSLRIVNWLKWMLGGGTMGHVLTRSIAHQARCLEGRLEYHLLGNHLFSNAKALVFAGLFFEGDEPQRWLEKGLGLLSREIPEQILRDGGQFERSPMYHALAYEDVLDLINLTRTFSDGIPEAWRTFVEGWPGTATAMRRWLAAMTHPDGGIAFFNDAAFGVAPDCSELTRYADELSIQRSDPARPLEHMAASGYVRAELGDAILIADVAEIGPDYLPGHAHADTLSFELSVFGRRVVVNGGTSQYGASPEREVERGTGAHSTVAIDEVDSSEVWAGFRVARRARPFGLEIAGRDLGLTIECAHDGYRRLPGRPVHRRQWRLSEHGLEVDDRIEGRCNSAIASFHLHPDVGCTRDHEAGGRLCIAGAPEIHWSAEGGTVRIEDDTHRPEFGVRVASRCIRLDLAASGATRLRLAW